MTQKQDFNQEKEKREEQTTREESQEANTSKPIKLDGCILVIGAIVLIIIICICFSFCSNSDSSGEPSTRSSSSSISTPSSSSKPAASSSSASNSSNSSSSSSLSSSYDASAGTIKSAITKMVKENYKDTDIDSITINQDAGKGSGYIALVNLTWNVKNSGAMSKTMLSRYSEDLAARVGSDCPEVNEIAVFWEVPYLNATAKVSYERKGSGMVLSDQSWGSKFN